MSKFQIKVMDMEGVEILPPCVVEVDNASNILSPNSEFARRCAEQLVPTVASKIIKWLDGRDVGTKQGAAFKMAQWLLMRGATETRERDDEGE